MLEKSVVRRSGQLWKLVLAVICLMVGSFAPVYPETGISWTAGTIIAIGGYLFGLVAIRCGQCNSRWFWEAAKDAGLYGPLFKSSECPDCECSYPK